MEEKEKSFSRKGSFPLPRLSSGGEAAQKEFVPAGSSHQQDKKINKNELNEKSGVPQELVDVSFLKFQRDNQ